MNPNDDPSAPKPPQPPPLGALGSIDPGELLARALHTAQPSPGVAHWTPPTPEILAALLPQYHIASLLGHGGMGAVYKGRQAALDRPVAIKLLPAELGGDAQFIARFQREARTLAKLQHPGIVTVYDFGQTSEGHLYFVMEFVDGTDLHRILHAPGGLNPAQALELISQICDALHYAHGKGVIHRDIKPGNILVTTESRAKLADFGLARPIKEESTMLTGANVIMGTEAYMAPEQREGHADQRADIYALGVMLYEMLCGQCPRGAFDLPSHRVQVDVRLDDVVIKAMQQQPERRYQQVSEMKTDVDRIRTTPHQRKPAPKPKSKSPVTVAIITVCLALASAGGFVIWKKGGSSPGGTRSVVSLTSSPDATKSAGTPTASAKQNIDLIALVDVQRDRLKAEGKAGANHWTKSGGQLAFVSVDQRAGKIGAPVALNGLRDYEVEVGVSNAPAAGVILDFPISATNQATIAFVPGEVVLVRDESGKLQEIGKWPTGAASPPWKLAARVRLDVDRINGTLSANVNGLPVGEWRGALGHLGRRTESHPEFPGQFGPALFVPSGDLSHSSWTLRVFDGEAKVLREAAAPIVSASPATAVLASSSANSIQIFAGHRYQFVPGEVGWDEAKAKAEDMGGHLATVTSEQENDWIRTTFGAALGEKPGSSHRLWLGALATQKGGSWKWVTGEPFEYQRWAKGEPDGLTNGGKPAPPPYALKLSLHRSLEWTDASADDRTVDGFLVEWEDAGSAPATTPAPQPASTGEAWVRKWNLPDEHGGNSPLTVVDGWVVRRSGASQGTRNMPVEWHDQAIRAECRWAAGENNASLSLRVVTGEKKDGQMYSLVRTKRGVSLNYRNRGNEDRPVVLKEYPVSEPKDGDTYTLELRAVGTTLTAKLDGQEIIRVEDDKLTSGGPNIYVFEKGGMRNIEVLNLD